MHLIYNLAFILAAWRWGDWKNWQQYYPTMIFFILMDLLQDFLTYNHPFWLFHDIIISTHTIIALSIMLMKYPAIILIYLKYFYQTNNNKKRVFHFTFWVLLYAVHEYVNLQLGFISHHNGWNMGWSFLFIIIMFSILTVHYKNPLIAWGLSFLFLIILCFNFDFWQYME